MGNSNTYRAATHEEGEEKKLGLKVWVKGQTLIWDGCSISRIWTTGQRAICYYPTFFRGLGARTDAPLIAKDRISWDEFVAEYPEGDYV